MKKKSYFVKLNSTKISLGLPELVVLIMVFQNKDIGCISSSGSLFNYQCSNGNLC